MKEQQAMQKHKKGSYGFLAFIHSMALQNKVKQQSNQTVDVTFLKNLKFISK